MRRPHHAAVLGARRVLRRAARPADPRAHRLARNATPTIFILPARAADPQTRSLTHSCTRHMRRRRDVPLPQGGELLPHRDARLPRAAHRIHQRRLWHLRLLGHRRPDAGARRVPRSFRSHLGGRARTRRLPLPRAGLVRLREGWGGEGRIGFALVSLYGAGVVRLVSSSPPFGAPAATPTHRVRSMLRLRPRSCPSVFLFPPRRTS